MVVETKVVFPGSSEGKAPACNAGGLGSIPGWGEDPLEKEMAIHSGTLAWKIPWTEEPGSHRLWGRKESDRTERLHSLAHSLTHSLGSDVSREATRRQEVNRTQGGKSH